MSLSYSAITNHGKISLPSIESWGTNMNILKDPPKSLYTRRIDRVGQTSDITAMVDDSGDRACEGILQFARGVNPSVSVSYSNTNRMNGNGTASQNTNAFLPYRVGREGAIRLPIQTEYNLLPLSRQPRVWTSSFTNASFPDFSKQMMYRGTAEQMRQVKNELLNTSIRPTAVYKVELPMEKPYETKNKIQNSLNISASSGFRTMDLTTQYVAIPNNEIKNANNTSAHTNKVENRYVNNNEFSPDRFIQDSNAHAVDTTKGANHIQLGHLDEFIDLGEVRVRDSALNFEGHSGLRGIDKNEYIHGDLVQDRNLPYYVADTNLVGDTKVSYLHEDILLTRNVPGYDINSNVTGNEQVNYIHIDHQLERVLPNYSLEASKTQQNLQKTVEHEHMKKLNLNTPSITDVYGNKTGTGEINVSSRNAPLLKKIQPGGFDGKASMPAKTIVDHRKNVETDKSRMDKKVMSQHMGRFEKFAPYDSRYKQ